MIIEQDGRKYLSAGGMQAEIHSQIAPGDRREGPLNFPPLGFIRGDDSSTGNIVDQYIDPILLTAWQEVRDLPGLSDQERYLMMDDVSERLKEKRWIEITGVAPEESQFTVVIPAYKVDKMLPQVLDVFDLHGVPKGAHMHVIIISNGVSDHTVHLSPAIVEYLQSKGTIQEVPVKDLGVSNQEGKIAVNAQVVEPEGTNHRYHYLSVEDPNKGNTLNIGTQIAAVNGHPGAIGIDSNKFIEPNAIPHMYRGIRDHILTGEANVLTGDERFYKPEGSYDELVAGMTVHEFFDLEVVWGRSDYTDKPWYETPTPLGFMHAWNVQWVQDMGGYPTTWVEDDTLGALSEQQGKKVICVREAVVHRPERNTFQGRINELARRVTGAEQTRQKYEETYPGITAIMHGVYLFMDPEKRKEMLHIWAGDDPIRLAHLDLVIAQWDEIFASGMDTFQNSTATTWTADEVRDGNKIN